jgi:hypothetical protein
MEAVMNAHAVSYPSLQRRLIAERRSRALFLRGTTQHVSSGRALFREVVRAVVALSGVIAWGALIILIAS